MLQFSDYLGLHFKWLSTSRHPLVPFLSDQEHRSIEKYMFFRIALHFLLKIPKGGRGVGAFPIAEAPLWGWPPQGALTETPTTSGTSLRSFPEPCAFTSSNPRAMVLEGVTSGGAFCSRWAFHLLLPAIAGYSVSSALARYVPQTTPSSLWQQQQQQQKYLPCPNSKWHHLWLKTVVASSCTLALETCCWSMLLYGCQKPQRP